MLINQMYPGLEPRYSVISTTPSIIRVECIIDVVKYLGLSNIFQYYILGRLLKFFKTFLIVFNIQFNVKLGYYIFEFKYHHFNMYQK